jgi:hypothetical protein
VWNGDAREIIVIGCIGFVAWIFDEVLGALGKGQYKVPLNVTAIMVCLLIAINKVVPVFDAVARMVGLSE